MANTYTDKASELSKNYTNENRLLKQWSDELGDASNPPESDLPASWRDGWIEYLLLVIDIGKEKIAKLDAIAAATQAGADDLVKELNADYAVEIVHYKFLAAQCHQPASPAIQNLSNLLNREAIDRKEYFTELNT